MGVTKRDRIRNVDIKAELEMQSMLEYIGEIQMIGVGT